MLKSLTVDKFTVFDHAKFEFGDLNVIHGVNGTGKTQLLKLAYAIWSALAPGRTKVAPAKSPTKAWLEPEMARKLEAVLRPGALGHLVRRDKSNARATIGAAWEDAALDLEFGFGRGGKSRVELATVPSQWAPRQPVYLPAHEALTIFPGLSQLYERGAIALDETWADLASALSGTAFSTPGPDNEKLFDLLPDIEACIGGKLELANQRNFRLATTNGPIEIDLVAEGHRKLAMVAWLIRNATILPGAGLFWDEPEANLNPRLVKTLVPLMVGLAERGVQIFIATHSLFLLRELYVARLVRPDKLHTRYFGLHLGDHGVSVRQGDSEDDTGDIAALDESLDQSQRYLEAEQS